MPILLHDDTQPAFRLPLGDHQPPYSPDYGLSYGEQIAIGQLLLVAGAALCFVLWLVFQHRRTLWQRTKDGAIEATVTSLVWRERFRRRRDAASDFLQKRVNERLG